MKRIALIVWPVLLLGACGQGDDGAGTQKEEELTLVGIWVIDVEGTRAEVEKWPGSEDEKKEAMEFFAGEQMAAVELEARADGTSVARNRPGADGPVEGKWTVISKEGNKWILKIEEPDSPPDEPAEVTWIDKDHIRLVGQGKTDSIVLKRK
ncbi:MAG: hypothetical protein ACYTAF_16710 [Planctomycetota bacterium]|jgi:hypothetical protein